ncbi:hypothetical protein LguiA_015173 [Lonicera macranthoides]
MKISPSSGSLNLTLFFNFSHLLLLTRHKSSSSSFSSIFPRYPNLSAEKLILGVKNSVWTSGEDNIIFLGFCVNT